jgi:hypothetical protein
MTSWDFAGHLQHVMTEWKFNIFQTVTTNPIFAGLARSDWPVVVLSDCEQ